MIRIERNTNLGDKMNKEMKLDEQMNDYKYLLDSINSWIQQVDNKISIYCGLYTVVLAAIVFLGDHLLPEKNETEVLCNIAFSVCHLFIILSSLSFIISIIMYTLSVKPNMLGEKEKQSFSLFYKDISQLKDQDTFISLAKEAQRKDFLTELLREIYYNSDVCTRKMKRFQVAVIASLLSILFAMFACVSYYFSF